MAGDAIGVDIFKNQQIGRIGENPNGNENLKKKQLEPFINTIFGVNPYPVTQASYMG